MGGAGDSAELPEGLRGVIEERLEAGLNELVMKTRQDNFCRVIFFVHRFFSVLLVVWDAWVFSRKRR